MKVAVLTTISRKSGGLFYSVRGLSKALAEASCASVVLSPRDEFSEADAGVWHPLPVELFPAYGPLKTSPAMRRRLMALDADLVHVHGIWLDSQWAAMTRQKKAGTPVVVSPRGMLDEWAVRNSSWKKRAVEKLFAREALERASCINALCRSEADAIRAYGLKNPIALIPNGIDLPDLSVGKARDGEEKRLLFIGRIHPKKGLRELLQAWAEFKSDGQWKLLIAGWDDGGHEAGLKALASDLALGDRVEFIGSAYGEQKDRLLRSVDAFILPSFSEGLPMSVLEAWSYALPVVMTDFCNLPEGFSAGAALRVQPEPASIADGLARLANLDEETLSAMGREGRRLAEEKFSWASIAERMARVYEWCLNGGEAPECVEI